MEKEINKELETRKELTDNYEKIQLELAKVDKKLENDYHNREELNSIIYNTQSAFEKILENTKSLYGILKKDESILNNRR